MRTPMLALSCGLALASFAIACGGAHPAPVASPAPSASATRAVTVEGANPASDPVDPGAPCRCSWDTDASRAARVCKRGEENYAGNPCVPSGGPGPCARPGAICD